MICKVIKRFATKADTLAKATLHSFEQRFEYQGGRMLLGVYRRGADPDPTRVMGPSVLQKEKSTEAITGNCEFTDFTPKIKSKPKTDEQV
uniref:Uncharacterized protein n=1 Tax=Panagrolaimus davidi TaxID=227884 RepID=A0A914PAE4_9BILA